MVNKKLVAIISGVAVVAMLGCGFYYKNKVSTVQASMLENSNLISDISEKFNTSENRENKLEELKEIISKRDEYQKNKLFKEAVLTEYNTKIDEMRKYFVDEYNKILADNSIENLAEESNAESIKEKINNLNNFLNMLNEEKAFVLSSEDADKYETQVNNLIVSYNSRLKAIEENQNSNSDLEMNHEEVAAQEAQEIVSSNISSDVSSNENYSDYNNSSSNNYNNSYSDSYYADNSYSNDSYSSSSSSNTSSSYESSTSNNYNGSSNGSWNSGMTNHYDVNTDTGEKIEGSDTFSDSQGNIYDSNGDFKYNLGEWGDFH